MTEENVGLPDPNSKNNNLISSLKNKFSIYTAFILFIFSLSLYIRTVIPYDAVFRGGIIGFASDDAVFHMRIVENFIENFPHKIWFEVFTLYPYGQSPHFGPLWTYMIGIPSLILGAGSPSLELTRTVGAYLPGILGALVVFPIYFIGKTVFDKRVGLLAAFIIAIMPGQFLSRSVMGFTDHHIGEVFFSSLYLMFFLIALKSVRSKDISLSDVQNKNWNKLKYPIIISIFTGIAFGLFMLQWSNGVLFGGIVAIFIVLQYIIDHMRGHTVDGLCLVSCISFLVAFPLVLLFVDPINGFQSSRYSYLHILITFGSSIFFLIMGLLSIKMREKKIEKIYYPFTIAGIYAIGLVIAKFFIPQVYSNFQSFFAIFQSRSGGYLTIAEASPPTQWMKFGSSAYPYNFDGSFPGIFELVSSYNLALLAMIVVGTLLLIRKWEPEKALFLIWCGTMFLLTTGQNRWFYYYAVNVAILVAFLGISLLDISGVKQTLQKFWNQVNTPNDLKNFILSDLKAHQIIIVILVILILFIPNFAIASRTTAGGPIGSGYYEWYESLNWMRYNTPETGLDFDAVYDRPPAGETFPYPDSAYGVMSWWDYGHVITYFGHRIPNANPFQAGIGGGLDHAPGASSYFTAQSEEDGNRILDELGINGKPGAKYIVSNAYMAYAILDVMGTWNNVNFREPGQMNYGTQPTDLDQYLMYIESYQGLNYQQVVNNEVVTIIALPSRSYYNSMEARLHILDTNGLSHYRLVHESAPSPNTKGGVAEPYYKYRYNTLYGGNLPLENSGYIKIFEYVNGATITGSAPEGATVTISNNIRTNDVVTDMFNSQGRLFTYTQTTTAVNGTYSLIVPYSTLGPIPGETNFDTRPTGPYSITTGNVTQSIDVAEQDVINSGTITVNLMG